MKSSHQRIFLDLEYCYPDMTLAKGRPSEQEKRQIVQISAIRFDMIQGKEIDYFDMLTRPAFEKKLPSFFTQLTGITQKMLQEKAVPFRSAFERLVHFCGDCEIWIFNADWSVLRQNCDYFDIPFIYQRKVFTKVKELLPEWGINPEMYSSGTLHRAAKVKMRGHVHNALHDVRSMAAAVRVFETRSAVQSR